MLTLLPATPADARHNSARLERTRREIRATRDRLRKALRSDREILAALGQLNRRLNLEQSRLSSARSRLARIDMLTRSSERRLARLAALRAQRRRVISERAAALYIMGPVNTFDAVTGAGSIGDVVERAGTLDFIASFDRATLQDLSRISHETRLTRRGLRVRYREMADVRNEIADRFAVVSEAADVKREAHQAYDDKIDAYRDELAALEREQARILNIVRSRGSTGSAYTGSPSRLGFVWPTGGRRITSPYGPRYGGYHTGMDIDCRTGDTIVAAKAGRVIASEWGGGYGNMVIIDHGGGYSTLYAHMSRRYVGDGSSVDQRQAIGACGSTGNSTGDHLHLEVRINGDHRNPRPYLP